MIRTDTSRILRTLAITALACILCLVSSGTGWAAPRKLSYIVFDVNADKILSERDALALRHPASLTKMMTLYLLFDAIETGQVTMSTKFRVSRYAASKPASKLYVPAGKTISVDQAIDALIIKSANDVAAVVAENLAGSESQFAQRMTQTARQLGMSQTTFKNASGLHHDEQVSTAYDMFILAIALQDRFPSLYKRFSKRSFYYGKKKYTEYNPMLGAVSGVDGLKTGYTRRSGFNLVTNRRHAGRHIVAVVMGAPSSANRSKNMHHLLSTGQKRASSGSRKAEKYDFPVYLSPITVSWAQGRPQVKVRQARGSSIIPAIKPSFIQNLPDDFYVRDQQTFNAMISDLKDLDDQNPKNINENFSGFYSWGKINPAVKLSSDGKNAGNTINYRSGEQASLFGAN